MPDPDAAGRRFDADWLEFDDSRRFYVGADGLRHIPAGSNARCGAGPVAIVLRPEEEIEFRCNRCWPARSREPRAFVRSNMGLVHACNKPGLTVCGVPVRSSWEAVAVREWRSEPSVCRSCDDVVMMRGRKAAT